MDLHKTIEAIRENLPKVTRGPWVWNGKHGSLHQFAEPPFQFGQTVLAPTHEYDSGSDVEISEADERHIALTNPETMTALFAELDTLRAQNAGLVAGLEKIAVGDGVYGAQAYEYKQIALATLAKARGEAGQ